MGKYTLDAVSDQLEFCQLDPTTCPPCAMSVYLCFDPQAGELDVESDYAIDGVPASVWQGETRRYPIPSGVNAVSFVASINAGELDDLLDRIAAGHTAEWDGSNWVGELNDDAEDAESELVARLEQYVDSSIAGLCDAEEWLGDTIQELGISTDTTDDQLSGIASQVERDALGYGARLYNTGRALELYRDDLIAEAREGAL